MLHYLPKSKDSFIILLGVKIVQYAVCVPNQDVCKGLEEDFECTAVARVVAFTLLALAMPPPFQEWHDAVAELGVWPVEYIEVLQQTPSAKRLKGRNILSPVYRGRKGNLPPFHTNSSSREQGRRRGRGRGRGERSGNQNKTGAVVSIRGRPYCSQKCLLGLRDGGSLDTSCPNFEDHSGKPIPSHNFPSLIQQQLAIDRGENADCLPLYKSGSYGALFKVRLSSHGFTLVAKGARYDNRGALLHEQQVYRKLRTIQGHYVPVCLGTITLHQKYPYYYDEGRYTHMLLLSWAGVPLTESSNIDQQAYMMIQRSLQAIHSQGVLHGDAEPRNILWNNISHRPMIVDFGRASMRRPLANVSPNTIGKKPNHAKNEKPFMLERRAMQHSLEALAQKVEELKI
ncbi:hypothetical protein CIRG_09896 [Coccidioides immitis RMSCC 2394]|uniref:Protein kinase domain-containing protein n=1 Tax=Coccidioides immitis RMSCC 2394 TaxID=404692 RepID=A0A0J6YQZ0_COCIT|nr:hypothetical protein CIRG_09896 [Coccidioides immitis RMSCC 2394]